jgi:alginate O-acetyltransferase complex protein AlgI
MIFNTWDYYLLFLVPSAILFRVSRPSIRPWIIVFGGSAFFVYFSYTQLGGAIGAACILIFLWESFVSRFYKPGSWFCFLGIVQTIFFLCLFKYRNFVSGLIWPDPGHNPLYWKNAFLPLGISFFTFEFIHYAYDRYKNKTEEGSVGEYMAFILFFPTMVAGPIKRYQDFLPKIRTISSDWILDTQRGFTRVLAGLAKKFGIADLLTAYTNHLNVADIAQANRGLLILWLFSYGIKIYVDFSAYSDIAIGSARLFGIKVPENFDWPYLQTNIMDFWRHWHISLSSWLMDYVYIPLGGSRVPVPRIYFNLLVTMFISGLWHGAGLNFIVWGLLHGLMLAANRWWRHRSGNETSKSVAGAWASWSVTFVAVNFSWAFFCMDIHTALFYFQRLIWG